MRIEILILWLRPFSATASLNTKCIVIPHFPLQIHSVFMYSDILLCRIEQYCVYSV